MNNGKKSHKSHLIKCPHDDKGNVFSFECNTCEKQLWDIKNKKEKPKREFNCEVEVLTPPKKKTYEQRNPYSFSQLSSNVTLSA